MPACVPTDVSSLSISKPKKSVSFVKGNHNETKADDSVCFDPPSLPRIAVIEHDREKSLSERSMCISSTVLSQEITFTQRIVQLQRALFPELFKPPASKFTLSQSPPCAETKDTTGRAARRQQREENKQLVNVSVFVAEETPAQAAAENLSAKVLNSFLLFNPEEKYAMRDSQGVIGPNYSASIIPFRGSERVGEHLICEEGDPNEALELSLKPRGIAFPKILKDESAREGVGNDQKQKYDPLRVLFWAPEAHLRSRAAASVARCQQQRRAEERRRTLHELHNPGINLESNSNNSLAILSSAKNDSVNKDITVAPPALILSTLVSFEQEGCLVMFGGVPEGTVSIPFGEGPKTPFNITLKPLYKPNLLYPLRSRGNKFIDVNNAPRIFGYDNCTDPINISAEHPPSEDTWIYDTGEKTWLKVNVEITTQGVVPPFPPESLEAERFRRGYVPGVDGKWLSPPPRCGHGCVAVRSIIIDATPEAKVQHAMTHYYRDPDVCGADDIKRLTEGERLMKVKPLLDGREQVFSGSHTDSLPGCSIVFSRHNGVTEHSPPTVTEESEVRAVRLGGDAHASEAAQAYQPTMILFGGTNWYSGDLYNDLWRFDVQTRCWGEIKDALGQTPSPRCGFSMGACERRVFVFGGENENFTLVNDLYCYDSLTNVWLELRVPAIVPSPRAWAGSCVVTGDHLIIIGGTNSVDLVDNCKVQLQAFSGGGKRTTSSPPGLNSSLADVWSLNMRTITWKELARPDRLNSPFAKFSNAPAPLKNSLSSSTPQSAENETPSSLSIEGFDVSRESVNQLLELPSETVVYFRSLFGHVCCPFDGYVVVYGGTFTDQNYNALIFGLNLRTERWIYLGDCRNFDEVSRSVKRSESLCRNDIVDSRSGGSGTSRRSVFPELRAFASSCAVVCVTAPHSLLRFNKLLGNIYDMRTFPGCVNYEVRPQCGVDKADAHKNKRNAGMENLQCLSYTSASKVGNINTNSDNSALCRPHTAREKTLVRLPSSQRHFFSLREACPMLNTAVTAVAKSVLQSNLDVDVAGGAPVVFNTIECFIFGGWLKGTSRSDMWRLSMGLPRPCRSDTKRPDLLSEFIVRAERSGVLPRHETVKAYPGAPLMRSVITEAPNAATGRLFVQPLGELAPVPQFHVRQYASTEELGAIKMRTLQSQVEESVSCCSSVTSGSEFHTKSTVPSERGTFAASQRRPRPELVFEDIKSLEISNAELQQLVAARRNAPPDATMRSIIKEFYNNPPLYANERAKRTEQESTECEDETDTSSSFDSDNEIEAQKKYPTVENPVVELRRAKEEAQVRDVGQVRDRLIKDSYKAILGNFPKVVVRALDVAEKSPEGSGRPPYPLDQTTKRARKKKGK